MRAIDLIRNALTMTEAATVALVADMREAPLTQPTSEGGNHPLWVMGHLAFIEGMMPGVILGEEGGANPVAHWAPLFAPGTQPRSEAGAYPGFDEVVRTFRELRQRTLALLERVGDEGLGRAPKAVPPGFEDAMRTCGETFMLVALHQMVHHGQIADARRVAGKRPPM